ncbi:hypothetical protein [Paraburkholderia tropica]|uniref:hypothetical protein n=1 Tax=Paraburkholderia tropica TaxID=92647 RepID=UPI000A99F3A4|nr:hypothetical protein [Paraburkholderia tropica]MDE1139972.1 hypothetical protein [Paraburkholderia tropica]
MADSNDAPAFALVVIHPFGDYAKGARIDDAEKIAEVMASENHHQVVKVAQ